MTARKDITRLAKPRSNSGERVKDEVYRQMFRLEESRPGSEIGLALALLHAWLDSGSKPENSEDQDWLKKISPICLEMIETYIQTSEPGRRCVQ